MLAVHDVWLFLDGHRLGQTRCLDCDQLCRGRVRPGQIDPTCSLGIQSRFLAICVLRISPQFHLSALIFCHSRLKIVSIACHPDILSLHGRKDLEQLYPQSPITSTHSHEHKIRTSIINSTSSKNQSQSKSLTIYNFSLSLSEVHELRQTAAAAAPSMIFPLER